MCLAVPAKIIELDADKTNAVVELNGVQRPANVAFIESPAMGDYVLIHAGFAIRKWTAQDLKEYQELTQS